MPATQQDIDFAEQLEKHYDTLLPGIKSSILRLREKRNNENRAWVNKQIQYWEQVESAFKWSLSIAKQKASKK